MTPEITARAHLIAILLSSLWLMGIVYLVIRESLALRSSLAWMFLGMLAVGVSVYPKSLIWFAGVTGIGLAVNALFLFGFFAVLIILFGHTLVITRLLTTVRRLTQQIALHELENRQSAARMKETQEGGDQIDPGLEQGPATTNGPDHSC